MILNTLLSRDLLIDAYKFHSRGDARAHDALSIILKRDEMQAAVNGCLEQAVVEDEPIKQKLYIHAARYGKACCPGVAIEEFQSTCRRVRVMNVLRSQNIDPQSDLAVAVDMLMAWKKFALALWIVEYLSAGGASDIRAKWSEFLIEQRQLKDGQVAEKIRKILGQNPSITYSEIANIAIERRRPQLAIKLIENETQSLQKIPLLLNLKQYDLVLAQTLASCNSNLIYMSIFRLRESIPSEIPFLELLKKHKEASRYYCNFLAQTDLHKLIMIAHKDNPEDELFWSLIDKRMESAITVSRKIRRDVVPQQIELCLRLQRFQHALNLTDPPPMKLDVPWTELSLSDTIINLIAIGQTGKARDAQKRFEVPDRKFKVLEQIATNTLPDLVI